MAEPQSKPHIVLVPGAWHKPVCYSLIIPKLEAAGYTVHSTQLPSVTDNNPPKDLNADTAALRQLVDEAIGPGNDVVVIVHSWSGTVAGSGLVGYSKGARRKDGKQGGVVRFGYMCSFMIAEGTSLHGNLAGPPPSWWTVKGDLAWLTGEAPGVLYNDLAPAERAHWIAQSSPAHGYVGFTVKMTGEAWLEIPTSYLLCEDDQAIPLAAQEAMTRMVKEKGGEVQTERISADHSPFLSRPNETAQWIRRVAGEGS